MADFPSIEPDHPREHVWGDVTQSVTALAGGVESRSLFTGPLVLTGEQLSLPFALLTLAQMELIRGHYRDQSDGHRAFALPLIVTACDGLAISRGPVWRYLSPPEEEDLGSGRFNCRVSLGASASTWIAPTVTW